MHKLQQSFILGFCILGLVSCSTLNNQNSKPQSEGWKPPFFNGSHQKFTSQTTYPSTHQGWMNPDYFNLPNNLNHLIIDIDIQRGYLFHKNILLLDYPISSGRPDFPTPSGKYQVLKKEVFKRSNQFGNLHDLNNNIIKTDLEMPRDKNLITPQTKFVGASMYYWMRLTWKGIGHHIGNVPYPRYAASHACIRGRKEHIPFVYDKLAVGALVKIVSPLAEKKSKQIQLKPIYTEAP